MIKHTTLLTTILLLGLMVQAQKSRVYEQKSMKSSILKSERNYAIYLPPGYSENERSYPVLYLLHGAGDDQTGWVQFGEIQHYADKAITEGEATAMIIVMPDANTQYRGYVNRPDGNWNYENFFFEEFIPHIETTYRIKREKRYRAIAGLSMGGGGSLYYALHHPELFSSACPLSAYVGPRTAEDVKRYYNFEDSKKVDSYLQKYNPIYLVEHMEEKQKKQVRWYIDCGDDDFLFEGNSLLHIAMRKAEIDHDYRVREGGHNWTYWREALPKVLSFVSDSFHQH